MIDEAGSTMERAQGWEDRSIEMKMDFELNEGTIPLFDYDGKFMALRNGSVWGHPENTLESLINQFHISGDIQLSDEAASAAKLDVSGGTYSARKLRNLLKAADDKAYAEKNGGLQDGDIVYENFRYDYTSTYRFYKVSGYNGKTATLIPIAHSGGSTGPYGMNADEVTPNPDKEIGDGIRKAIRPTGEFSPIHFHDSSSRFTDTGKWTKKGALDGPEYQLTESSDPYTHDLISETYEPYEIVEWMAENLPGMEAYRDDRGRAVLARDVKGEGIPDNIDPMIIDLMIEEAAQKMHDTILEPHGLFLERLGRSGGHWAIDDGTHFDVLLDITPTALAKKSAFQDIDEPIEALFTAKPSAIYREIKLYWDNEIADLERSGEDLEEYDE